MGQETVGGERTVSPDGLSLALDESGWASLTGLECSGAQTLFRRADRGGVRTGSGEGRGGETEMQGQEQNDPFTEQQRKELSD